MAQTETHKEIAEETQAVSRKLSGAKLLAVKGLDVDKLKAEVESRGGYDKVEAKREWRQIARAMNVPPNTCAEHLRRQYLQATNEGAALRFPQPQSVGGGAGGGEGGVPDAAPTGKGVTKQRKTKQRKGTYLSSYSCGFHHPEV
jgi:hypothetical protein